jgi:pSer/pThr/pTyr-binding forkhead associated (FHA) protein
LNYVALLFFVAAADILLVRLILRNDSIVKIDKKSPEIEQMPDKDILVNDIEGSESNGNQAKYSQTHIRDNLETSILNFEKKYPILSCTINDSAEIINITSDDFVIGRLKGQADYISENTAIGRLHARIVHKEYGYCITDLSTRNGTYINGSRLDGCKEYDIKSGDRITLANREYTFIV